ncbi:MAG: FAD-dependent oxidoreductase [Pseudomonadota bacterium]
MTDRPMDDVSTSDMPDPYARTDQIFPRLTEDQIGRVAAYGPTETLDDGTVLFRRGERRVDFFLVIEGAIEIIDREADGADKVITVHGGRQFTGELDLFNNRKILVDGRTKGPTKVVRLNREAFRHMSSTEQDIGEIIMRAFILRRTGFIRNAEAGVTIIGDTNDRDVIRINRFLSRNGYPVTVRDRGSAIGSEIATESDIERCPAIVRTADGHVYANPETAELADHLGLTEEIDADRVHDLAVVGAGPAGLSACVYAASEALDTVVIESEAPGGQAGTSSKIENYLGFPTGISGQALAGRAWIQGQKFGAIFAIARPATGISHGQDGIFRIARDAAADIRARAVILACGATYRKLDHLDGYDRYEGQGIHYAATALEAQFCTGTEAVVVGGGNSAGQAAVFLSRHASHVHVLVRGPGLADSMSDYLVSRIDRSPAITLHTRTELTALDGDRLLTGVTWRNRESGETTTRDVPNLFVMIGAVPNTAWMDDCVELDDRGFVRTGGALGLHDSPFATSVPGIFAVGDVRSGSVKRVASGVGEGSVCVSAVHGFLAGAAT